MGYGIRAEGTLIIPPENLIRALAALKIESAKERLDWTDQAQIGRAESVSEVLRELGWNWNRDTGRIAFVSEKIGSENRVWRTLAPYVINGRIAVIGEDGEKWLWFFAEGKAYLVPARKGYKKLKPEYEIKEGLNT